MSTIESSNKDNSLPDMNAISQSTKAINRAVPVTQDGAYSYFADSMNMGSTVAVKINEQITDALTTLPTSLQKLKSVDAFAKNIAKINASEKAGEIDSATAAKGRKQLEDRLNEGVSSVITNFVSSSNDLSESAERLSNYSKKIVLRLKDANSTEIANQERTKLDAERESERLSTLEARYEKMKEAVDEKRGGPLEDFISIIPDEEELSSLMDLGAEDAAAPEVAAAKKAVELAVKQIKKVLEVVEKTIEFVQLADIRDEVFKASQAQRKISNETNERLRTINETLGKLGTIKAASDAMETTGDEVGKMASTFSSFVDSLKNLDGEELTEATITNLYDSMNGYLEKVRKANNQVILG